MAKTKSDSLEVDYECNYTFLLQEFNQLWEHQPKDFQQFDLLVEKAKSSILTYRQLCGIIDRCKNVKNGTYGNTKKPEHYAQAQK